MVDFFAGEFKFPLLGLLCDVLLAVFRCSCEVAVGAGSRCCSSSRFSLLFKLPFQVVVSRFQVPVSRSTFLGGFAWRISF